MDGCSAAFIVPDGQLSADDGDNEILNAALTIYLGIVLIFLYLLGRR